MKGIIKRIKELFSTRPRLAVIDDSGMIHRVVTDSFSETHDVTSFYRIPNDLAELDKFDVLIVDGDGICNGKYRNGVEFLCDYVPTHTGKRYVHFTGFCNKANGDKLTALGCKVVSKGYRPDYLVSAVTDRPVD